MVFHLSNAEDPDVKSVVIVHWESPVSAGHVSVGKNQRLSAESEEEDRLETTF